MSRTTSPPFFTLAGMMNDTFWRFPAPDASRSFFDGSCTPSFVQHLCSRNFHQRIVCPRTGYPVTFAVCGDLESSHVVLYCLPSGCSRYLGIFMHGICALVGVKLIAIDRPGSGGTRMCPPEERLHVSLLQTISVLCSLDLLDKQLRPTGLPITLLAHSAGIFYALNLIQHFTSHRVALRTSPTGERLSPFGRRPRLLLSSPWVPTSVSKSPLALLPRSVIRMNTSVMPGLNKAFGALNASIGVVSKTSKGYFGWSAGVVKASSSPGTDPIPSPQEDDADSAIEVMSGLPQPPPTPMTPASPTAYSDRATSFDFDYNPFLSVIGLEPPPSPTRTRQRRQRDDSIRKHPSVAFHPPHELHYRYSMCHRFFPGRDDSHPATGKPFSLENSNTGAQLIMDMMAAEGYRGMTEDFLLSLGHAHGLPSSQLEDLIKQGIDACSKSRKGAEITVVWASSDKLVPAKGRAWLDDAMRQAVASSPLDSKRRKRLRYDRLEMADAGHDAPMGSEAVMVELLRRAKYGAAASGVKPETYWSSVARASRHSFAAPPDGTVTMTTTTTTTTTTTQPPPRWKSSQQQAGGPSSTDRLPAPRRRERHKRVVSDPTLDILDTIPLPRSGSVNTEIVSQHSKRPTRTRSMRQSAVIDLSSALSSAFSLSPTKSRHDRDFRTGKPRGVTTQSSQTVSMSALQDDTNSLASSHSSGSWNRGVWTVPRKR